MDSQEIKAVVKELREKREKNKFPCGCMEIPGFLLTCEAHALIDEMEEIWG